MISVSLELVVDVKGHPEPDAESISIYQVGLLDGREAVHALVDSFFVTMDELAAKESFEIVLGSLDG